MSRRASWTLIALGAWTLWVWLTFMWIIGHQDHPMGFKVVHGIIAVGSIAFGIAAARIGYRALRTAGRNPSTGFSADRREFRDREGLASR
jgi:hypothetical protein